jgi:hypothetical protein
LASRSAKAKKPIAKSPAQEAGDDSASAKLPGPSPSAATNLLLADLALRSGARLVRYGIERSYLGSAYSPGKAKAIVKGRGLGKTLLYSAMTRIATRSVPGAILVGGGLLAKVIYDRKKSRKAREEGSKKLQEQAEAGEES